ncbi:terminase [Glycomyces paridis]|uniref:Terminase n=1 Tax=Glycomyces paridis TaxID=2126555 RepID=A0A4S8PF39_9ACTN|nr:terminase [Glycomyces paridis]THV27932.1 terminase [Glycomyces paridis]
MAASRRFARSAKRRKRPPLWGCEIPRIWTAPLRELTPETTLGYEVIEFAEAIGVTLMPWQQWFLIHALELRPDGNFRFRKIILLVARQNGKSTLLQVLTLWRMYVDRCRLVIGTAQDLDTAEEVWEGAVELAQSDPELAAEIAQVLKVNGKKTLKLTTGERYKVRTANRKGGRGLSGELVLLDELREHQSWDAWAAVTKTTNAMVRAQIIAASNAGDATSIVLRYLRMIAHRALGDPDGICEADGEIVELDGDDLDDFDDDEGTDDEDLDGIEFVDGEDFEDEFDADDGLGIFEWSAVPGCPVTDRTGWAQANPALGHTITERTIASDAKIDPEWIFRTEVLCQWNSGSNDGPFPAGAWEAGTDADSAPAEDSPVSLCVDVSWDRTRAYVALAAWREDAAPHVEIIASRTGTDWVPRWLTAPDRDQAIREAPVVVQSAGAPVIGLIPDLLAAGVTVTEWKGPALGGATGDFYDRVCAAVREAGEDDVDEEAEPAPGVWHRPQPVLDNAAATAVAKPIADYWVIDRRNSPNDAAPLIAVIGALHGLKGWEPPTESAYESRELVTV